MCRALRRFYIAVLLAGLGVFGITSSFADAWNITVGGPNGRKVPRVMGGCSDLDASGYTALDYFEWLGITHYRYWFRLGSSPLNPTGGVTTATGFNNATALIRTDPLRQGTASDVYYDWNFFKSEFGNPYVISTMVQRGIQPMMVNTTFSGEKPLSSWGAKFRYWKTWYAYVYYFASNYGVQMYEFKNEPDLDADVTYAEWESHWIVAADAMRKAMADVNENYGKSLTLRICGPTTAGNGWTSYGQPSWSKVRTNIHGAVDPSIWNYGMYAYHHYTNSGPSLQNGILDMRNNLTNATPSSSMPIVLSEFNTSTGSNLRTLGLDTEDIDYGIGLSKILPGTATNGPTGLGDEGGTFLFKLADTDSGAAGIENKVVYMSPNGNHSLGGITRGGATYQLFARHFRGGKSLLGTTMTAGSHAERRLVAALDEEKQAYYIYLSSFSGTDATVTLNLSALDVLPSSPVTIARVNQNLTGHIGQIVTVSPTKQITFDARNKNALLIWIPKGKAARTITQSFPVQDTYLTIGQPAVTPGSETSMKISMHHSDPNERRIGFLRFDLNDLTNGNRFLLKIPGINSGTNTTARRILHVYGAGGGTWDESNLTWATAPGIGKYRNTPTTLLNTTGLGPMVDIEANYKGATAGNGLGLHGKFLGPVSYFTGVGWAQNYLDVTDYVKSLMAANQTSATFVIAQTVRYNVNTFSNDYYNKGVYDYNGQITEIGTREHPNSALRSALVTHFDDQTARAFDPGNLTNGEQIDPASGTWNLDFNPPLWNNGINNVEWTQSSSTQALHKAVFGGVDGTYSVTVSGQIAALGLQFNNSVYTLSGGDGIHLPSGAEIHVSTGKSAVIYTPLLGSHGWTKIGGGNLVTYNAMNYSGQTTVSEGKLIVRGSIGGQSPVVVTSGGRVEGSGTIHGSLVSSGTVAPGGAPGTLTIGGNAVLSSGGEIQMDLNIQTGAKDYLNVGGALTYGGTLVIQPLGATAYVDRQVIKFFNASSYSGTFSSISPAIPAVGFVWNTNRLAVDGTIQVRASTITDLTTLVGVGLDYSLYAGSTGAASAAAVNRSTPNAQVGDINNSSQVRRSVFAFDIPETIPAGNLASARLKLYYRGPANGAIAAGGAVSLFHRETASFWSGNTDGELLPSFGLNQWSDTGLDMLPSPSEASGYYTVDVTDQVRADLQSDPTRPPVDGVSNRVMSHFLIRWDLEGTPNAFLTFDAVEGTAGDPVLELTTVIPDNFESWISGSFVNGGVPIGQRGPNDDPDDDGICNLLEYAIADLDPTVGNSFSGNFVGNKLEFNKRNEAAGLIYAIQKSSDLGIMDPWTAIPAGTPNYINSPSMISYIVTPGSPSLNFIRLQVTMD